MNLVSSTWKTFDEVDSTQLTAFNLLLGGEDAGIIFARHQTAGKGRFDRTWHSAPGEIVALSLIFDEHPRPYLLGMACAISVAKTLDCQIQWPNDVVLGGKKVAGILTEIKVDRRGKRLPVVGIGINLNQDAFPDEISMRASSLKQQDGVERDPFEVAKAVVHAIRSEPTPKRWNDLRADWMHRDTTPGKAYQFVDGRKGVADHVGSEGELVCNVGGTLTSVYAAEALFGSPDER